MNASFSLPPHSESTSILPAERAAGFELAVAANVAATAPSTTASTASQERRFNSIPPRPRRPASWPPLFRAPRAILPFSTGRDEAFLGLRIEHVQVLVQDRELDLVTDLDLPVARDESHDLVALDLRVQQLLIAEVLDDVHVRGEANRTVARAVGDLQVLRPEPDLELLAVPLLRDLRPRAAQVQELLAH